MVYYTCRFGFRQLLVALNMKKKIYIIIGCDTDPDRDDYIANLPKHTLSWSGMCDGIPTAKSKLEHIKDSKGNSPIFSWCLRVDEQIKEVHGSYEYILRTHKDLFLELESTGDELAWHPHFWKYDNTQSLWYQECNDIQWQVRMLEEAYSAYQQVFPGRARSVRMGWDFHNYCVINYDCV